MSIQHATDDTFEQLVLKNDKPVVFDITVTFVPAATVSGKVAGCPNGNWLGINPVSNGITSATLLITQAGKTIFNQTYDNPNN